MTSLVVAEHDNRILADATARTITAARALGQPVEVLVAGHGCQAVADAAAGLDGVDTVLLCDDPLYAHPLAEPFAALILSLAERWDAVLAPATSHGKAVLPRVAALLDVPQISEITKVLAPDTFERPVYAGSVMATVKAPAGKLAITVRPTAFAAAGAAPAPAPILSLPAGPDPGLSAFAGETLSQAAGPELTSSKVVVAGGRGLGTADNFQLLAHIAGRLNAAVGASRAAVDAGFAANDCQIGQTGKVVAPELYIALGISGALQHLCGIKDAKTIVAINKDDEAPIFQVADLGLVADLFQVLPEIDAELARRGYN
ncbi:electron transfer flavoprotein subunit alpha/FixB family protein [Rhizomicrobium electricum]|uniref:FAD-binding protein n=1 Tax=Rhizomicrobium electricum TaxID=480070 RepID=A0ABP3Q7M9_9PROT|nr:FAD-binding protein [Rhizomicrobium electricum]NIJ49396.1 electron transfer flavoprotein alpha subunit [Rhizomicrobium electricum]